MRFSSIRKLQPMKTTSAVDEDDPLWLASPDLGSFLSLVRTDEVHPLILADLQIWLRHVHKSLL